MDWCLINLNKQSTHWPGVEFLLFKRKKLANQGAFSSVCINQKYRLPKSDWCSLHELPLSTRWHFVRRNPKFFLREIEPLEGNNTIHISQSDTTYTHHRFSTYTQANYGVKRVKTIFFLFFQMKWKTLKQSTRNHHLTM